MKQSSPVLIALFAAAAAIACGTETIAVSTDENRTDPAANGGAGGVTPNGGPAAVPVSEVDLRADTNRDGVVSFTDDADDVGEDDWNDAHGAVFLANIDDDEEVCELSDQIDDVDLPKCNDAADEVINGPDDLLDLARLATKPWADVPSGAVATIKVSAPDQVRVFKLQGNTYEVLDAAGTVTIDEIREGLELGIEARDIVRDLSVWDGFVDVTYEVSSSAGVKSDKVRMRVAPLLTSHHLSPTEATFVSALNTASSRLTRADLATAAAAAGVPAPFEIGTNDQWTQDFFETGFMAMPAAGGKQHAIRAYIRSANVQNPNSTRNPLRYAGRIVFALRGKDAAAIQQYDLSRRGRFDTLNSFGNLETIPPYTNGEDSFPMGRILRGSIPSYNIDRAMQQLMEAQTVQKPIYVDTSWLIVGHVDETMSFVKAPTPRGWVLLVNDAREARQMLEAQVTAGNGNVPMFVGKRWDATTPAQVTISQVLADVDVMASSAEAAIEVDAQLAIVRAATGLKDNEIIKIPFLHVPYTEGSAAYQPGLVNGLYLNDGHFVAPDPHGPIVGGQDIFKKVMSERLAAIGVTVHYAENWDLYHRNLGEIHCGTNSLREVPAAKWWESGR